MRLVYMDESGIAPHEPYMVVAGVIIDGDRQLVPLENHLDILVQKHIPEEAREGFIFHATDIWSGKKYFEDRKKWPWDRRLSILEDLAKSPRHFDLPVAWAFVEKAKYPPPPLEASGYTANEITVATHVSAFTDCALVVEVFMRHLQTEVALLIAEDRDIVRTAIKEAHAWYRSPAQITKYGLDKNHLLPFRHIRDTVHWAKKEESRHLQLADACAFILKGHLNKQVTDDRLFLELQSHLLVLPVENSVSVEQRG